MTSVPLRTLPASSAAKPTESAAVMQSLRKYEALFRSEDYQPYTRVHLLPPVVDPTRS